MGMRKIYRKIARENGVSAGEVREEIQAAIDYAYRNVPKDGGVTAAYQQQVPHKGEIPTPEEVIQHLAGKTAKNSIRQ